MFAFFPPQELVTCFLHGRLSSVCRCCLPGGEEASCIGECRAERGAQCTGWNPQPVSGVKVHTWRQTSKTQVIFTGRRNPTTVVRGTSCDNAVNPKPLPNLESPRGLRDSLSTLQLGTEPEMLLLLPQENTGHSYSRSRPRF